MKQVIEKIRETIKNTIFENNTFIVGGYVRDILMKKEHSTDLDLVVNLDNGGIRLAEYLFKSGISTRPVIFKNFGTSYIKINEIKIELVMTRSESYRDKNRKPEVRHASLEEDVYRRDFTINSLMINLTNGEILDLTGKGLMDLKNGIIRTTSDPDRIFKEDPLRILRAVRFANRLKFDLEKETQNALITNREYLNHISTERKRDEFTLMITSDSPVNALELLRKNLLLYYIIPELNEIINLKQNKYHDRDVWNHTLRVIEKTEAILPLRLAALLHDIGKKRCFSEDEKGIHFYGHERVGAEMTREILTRLKYPKETIKTVTILVKNHMRFKQSGKYGEKMTDKTLRRIILQLNDNLEILLQLVHADNMSNKADYNLPEQVNGLRKRINALQTRLTEEHFPLTGNDIIGYFSVNEGIEVGEYLKRAKEIWLGNPKITKKELLKKLVNGNVE